MRIVPGNVGHLEWLLAISSLVRGRRSQNTRERDAVPSQATRWHERILLDAEGDQRSHCALTWILYCYWICLWYGACLHVSRPVFTPPWRPEEEETIRIRLLCQCMHTLAYKLGACWRERGVTRRCQSLHVRCQLASVPVPDLLWGISTWERIILQLMTLMTQSETNALTFSTAWVQVEVSKCGRSAGPRPRLFSRFPVCALLSLCLFDINVRRMRKLGTWRGVAVNGHEHVTDCNRWSLLELKVNAVCCVLLLLFAGKMWLVIDCGAAALRT